MVDFTGRREGELQTDPRLIILSAIVGLFSAALLELIKVWIERSRQRLQEQRARQHRKSAEVAEFLRGAEAPLGRPTPAWLRLIVGDRKRFSLRISLRRLPLVSGWLGTTDTLPVKISITPAKAEEGPAARMLQAARLRGGQKGRKLLLGPLTLIGRSPLCDVCLESDEAVSYEHALIRYEEDGYYLYDLGSKNGTYLDGVRLEAHTRAPLLGGEILTLGRTHFEFGARRSSRPRREAGKGGRPKEEKTAPPGPNGEC